MKDFLYSDFKLNLDNNNDDFDNLTIKDIKKYAHYTYTQLDNNQSNLKLYFKNKLLHDFTSDTLSFNYVLYLLNKYEIIQK